MKAAFYPLRHLLDSTGLGEAGGAFYQQVTVGEERDKQFMDEVLLANNLAVEPLLELHQWGCGHRKVSFTRSCTLWWLL